jgi:outer membrane protein assembly factor BamB
MRWPVADVMMFVILIVATQARAADWLEYRGDAQRGGVTDERLPLPLAEHWQFQSTFAPKPAWPDPALENAYGRRNKGRLFVPLLTFDRAFHTVAAGGRVYFGSSADHKVCCLDAASGAIKWVFFTEGPVRMAPTIVAGKVYIGSDDGYIYCLSADTGDLVWKYRLGPNESRLPGNEQIVSRWPVRSGVVVKNNVAYAAAGIFPKREGAFLAAVNATSGKQIFKHKIGHIAQGYLLASANRLFVSTGEGSPVAYNLRDGKLLTGVSAPRGNFALIANDMLISGPSWWGGQLAVVKADQPSVRLTTFRGNQLVTAPDMIYVLKDDQLSAISPLSINLIVLDRQKKQLQAQQKKHSAKPDTPEAKKVVAALAALDTERTKINKSLQAANTWKQPSKYPYSLIRAGNVLFAGGDGQVAAFNTADGKIAWTAKVDGKAYGLAVADGRLLVSTDKGTIHAFGSGAKKSRIVKQEPADPFAQDKLTAAYSKAAETIVAATPFNQGYALVLGCGQGRLAHEIAKRTKLTIIAVDPDANNVAAARRALDKAGLYGDRVVVHHGPLNKLPYTKYMFNLIVSDSTLANGALPPSASELYRVLRPSGGVAYIGQPGKERRGGLTKEKLVTWLKSAKIPKGKISQKPDGLWAVVHRGTLPGSGEWSHQYANVGNTVCSEDQAITRPLQMQWYGRPGPRHMFDRHSFAAGPVSAGGRLFTPGEKVLFGQDAYNGTLLWTANIPEMAPRVNIPRDCGFLAASDQHIYVGAGENCLDFKADTGERLPAIALPSHSEKYKYEWGYVAINDGLLFGSGVRQNQFYRRGRGPWYDRDKAKVNSDFLFAVGQDDRKLKWKYNGVVINSTITIGGGRVYFLEQRDPRRLELKTRLLDEWNKLRIVALDEKTGRKVWEIDPGNYGKLSPIFYFCYKDEILTVARMSNVYEIWAYNAAVGKQLWFKNHRATHYHHGGHRRKTLIIGNTVLQEPVAYDLKTGKKKWTMTRRAKCGTLSASAGFLFARHGYHSMFDIGVLEGSRKGDAAEQLTSVTRPGCWINIITAGGLILTPEASSGCSCGYPVRATMAFVSQ